MNSGISPVTGNRRSFLKAELCSSRAKRASGNHGSQRHYWNASLPNRTRACATSARRSAPIARCIRSLARWSGPPASRRRTPLENVLSTIVAKAVQLSGTEAGAIYVFDDMQGKFYLRATYGMDQELIDKLTGQHIGLDETNVAQALAQHEPVQIADLNVAAPPCVPATARSWWHPCAWGRYRRYVGSPPQNVRCLPAEHR
jgi:hypothetical protein